MRFPVLLFLCLATIALTADEPARVKINIQNQPSFGPADAPVTIVEFGDFQCPTCKSEAPVLRQLVPRLAPGQVRVVFKDFPLESVHPWARAAAIAARCIYRQNHAAFWGFYDYDYEHQDEITPESLKSRVLFWAKANGLKAAELDRCIETKATDAEIAANINDGKAIGVKGTPGIYINGRVLSSPSPLVLRQMLAEELAAHDGKK